MSYYDFEAGQGETFDRTLVWTLDDEPVNLSAYSVRMQVRRSYSSPTVVFSLTEGDGITVDDEAGSINLFISATDTAAAHAGEYVYDIELEDSEGIVDRFLEGKFSLSPEVTR